MSNANRLTIVLVYGAWHGSRCWKFQTPLLEALGFNVENVDLPCISGTPGTTQFNDAARVQSVVESLLEQGKRVAVLAYLHGGPIGSAALAGLSQEHSG